MYLVWSIAYYALFTSAYILPQGIPATAEVRKQLGFDLSSSHGTVAVAYNNGSKYAIARIEGSEDYKQTMKEMSRWRRWPPFAGHPNQQSIYETMLNALKSQAEHFLGYSVDAALVTMPDLGGHRASALDTALRSTGLRNLEHYLQEANDNFAHAPALFAAAGMGLCDNYHNIEACLDQLHAMPRITVLTILFTSNSLCVQLSDLRSAYQFSGYDTHPSSMDFSLGYEERHNNPDERYFWNAVNERIVRVILSAILHKPVMIFVNGDSTATADHNLRIAIDEATDRTLKRKLPIYDTNPETAAALGAAEIARRGSWPFLRDPQRDTHAWSWPSDLVAQG